MTNQISAKIIADSKNENDDRITTFVLVMPRLILAEFNTHRMISRNSASSRAIPFEKMLKTVKETPFIPIKWMKDHTGMQGTEYYTIERDVELLTSDWLYARDVAVKAAELLSQRGCTKQVVNRIMEPYMYHTVIATGTEWENFFALRAHEAAEIHMQDLAYKMLEVYNSSEPKQLKEGEWHIPFGDKIDEVKILSIVDNLNQLEDRQEMAVKNAEIKIATARCARVSYTVVGEEDKKDNYENDIKLHDRLLAAGHMSPFEHCAKAMSEDRLNNSNGWSGNFYGFTQYRKTLQGENKSDNRIKK